jgi:hypothetical protein
MKNQKMSLHEMTCCSWHSPRNAIVITRTGAPVPNEVLAGIPNSPEKEQMLYSGNMCDPCARRFAGRHGDPISENIRTATPAE